jgi:hypothetical protein
VEKGIAASEEKDACRAFDRDFAGVIVMKRGSWSSAALRILAQRSNELGDSDGLFLINMPIGS